MLLDVISWAGEGTPELYTRSQLDAWLKIETGGGISTGAEEQYRSINKLGGKTVEAKKREEEERKRERRLTSATARVDATRFAQD